MSPIFIPHDGGLLGRRNWCVHPTTERGKERRKRGKKKERVYTPLCPIPYLMDCDRVQVLDRLFSISLMRRRRILGKLRTGLNVQTGLCPRDKSLYEPSLWTSPLLIGCLENTRTQTPAICSRYGRFQENVLICRHLKYKYFMYHHYKYENQSLSTFRSSFKI